MSDRLNELCTEWLAAKQHEAEARKARVAIEDEILPLIESKDEGSTTTNLDQFKIKATYKINRKLCTDWEEAFSLIPENMRPVKTTHSLDAVGVKWLMNNEPAIYASISTGIESKPAKPGITIEATEAK